MKNGHFDARGTLASLEAPKFFFNFFGFHICDRAWFQLRVAPPTAFVAPIVTEKIVSNHHYKQQQQQHPKKRHKDQNFYKVLQQQRRRLTKTSASSLSSSTI